MLFFLGYPGDKHKSAGHLHGVSRVTGENKSSKQVQEVKQKVKERCQTPPFPLPHSLVYLELSQLTGLPFFTTNILKIFNLKRNVEIAILPASNPLSMLPLSFLKLRNNLSIISLKLKWFFPTSEKCHYQTPSPNKRDNMPQTYFFFPFSPQWDLVYCCHVKGTRWNCAL